MDSTWLQLKRYWYGILLFSLSLLIHLGFYIADPNRGNSAMFRVLAGIISIFCVLNLLLVWQLTAERVERIRSLIQRFRLLFVILAIFILAVFVYLSRPEWIYTHTLLLVITTIIVSFWTFYGQNTSIRYERAILLTLAGVILAIVIASRLYSLSYAPPVDLTDEAWVMSWAVSYARYGDFNHTIMLFEIDLYRYYVLVAQWFNITSIGHYQGRLLSLLLIGVQALFVFGATKNLYNRKTALFALLLTSVSAVVIIGARLRHDAAITFAIAMTIWFYSLALRTQWRWWHFFAGLVLGLGAFGHYHASGFGVALTIGLYLPDWWKRWRTDGYWLPSRAIITFVIGGMLGFGIVAWFQILPGADTLSLGIEPRNPQSIIEYVNALTGHLSRLMQHSRLEFTLMLLAVTSAFQGRHLIDVRLALSVVLMQVLLAVMAGPGSLFDYYSVPMMPFYLILIARFLDRFSNRMDTASVTGKVLPFILCLSALFITALQPTLNGLRTQQPLIYPPPAPAQWILDNAETDVHIAAENWYYLFLFDYEFTSPSAPYLAPHDIRPQNRDDLFRVWDSLAIDYFIYDPTLATSAPMRELVESGYMELHNYEPVATWGTITIFGASATENLSGN